MARRCLVVGGSLALICGGGVGPATAGARNPAPITRPGGLLPGAVPATTGDCSLAGVTCRPPLPSSCSGYSSQTTPPATIRVLVRTSSTAATVQTVPFQTYVENVLPNEWPPSWDADTLQAGAVAVKSYAWYWVTHFGGYVKTAAGCFDVTDDTSFQVYRAGSANDRTTAAVITSWPVAARVNGRIYEASYRAYLHSPSDACGEDANGSELSQYGAQACNEASTGNKYNVILQTYYYPGLQLSTAQQLREQHDFQFQQRSTRVVFDAGHWVLDDGYSTTFSFGVAGDHPVVVTNGDGFAHIGVFRPSTSTWYLGSPTGHVASRVQFGTTGDIPVQAQYAGEQQPTVIAVFRPSDGTWYEATSDGRVVSKVQWGTAGDIPVPGHYAGDPTTDYADGLAVFRPSNGDWFIQGQPTVHFGTRGDIPMPADYNGDGTTDLAVYRPSTNTFFLRGQPGIHYGTSGDIPVTGDFTGDGATDLSLYRPSTHAWFVPGAPTEHFGSTGDTPIGAAPYSD